MAAAHGCVGASARDGKASRGATVRPSTSRLARCCAARLTGSRSAKATMASSSEIEPRNTLSGANARCTIFPHRPRADRTAASGAPFEFAGRWHVPPAGLQARTRGWLRAPLTDKVSDLCAFHSAHEPHVGPVCLVVAPKSVQVPRPAALVRAGKYFAARAGSSAPTTRAASASSAAPSPQLQDRQVVPDRGTRGSTRMAGRGRCEHWLEGGMARVAHRSSPRWRAAFLARCLKPPLRHMPRTAEIALHRAAVRDLPAARL